MRRKDSLKRIVSFVAAFVLAASMVPAPALAEVLQAGEMRFGAARELADREGADQYATKGQEADVDAGTQTGLDSQADAWDGVTQAEPAREGGVYQIGTGAELAWFAAQVNAGVAGSYNVVLTADIDLANELWTPIGKNSTNGFKGTFDGGGFTIEGLNVQADPWTQAGLFGYLTSGATVRNVVVKGNVKAENNAAGGLISRADGTVRVENCGSEVDVENTASGGRAAGIVGWAYDAATIVGCFNRGSVSAGDRASGIVADSGMSTTLTNCYNTGAISGAKVNGIGVSSGITYENCYNAGGLTGTSTAYAIGASNYATYTNCHYLEGSASNEVTVDGAPVALTATQMKAPAFVETLGTSSWKVDAGGAVNGGFPLLSWEKVADAQGVELAAPTGLSWLEVDPPAIEGVDVAYETMPVSWQSVDGASAYKVKLYREGEPDALFESDAIEENAFDFFDAFASLGAEADARYSFTVTALGDGTAYLDSDESAPDETGFVFDGAAFVRAPAQTTWNEASKIGVWSRVDGAEFYIVALYRGAVKVSEYELDSSVLGGEGPNLSMHFLSQMTGTGEYFFTVRAGKTVASGPNAGKRAASALVVSATTRYEAAQGETVEIASADDWMRIVNTTREGTSYMTDADAQNVEWAKNYVITADLDFSNLDAEQQQKTKSWGNVDARFAGTLDGQGHKITGLTLSNGDAGLFEYIGETGVVKNLTVSSANVLFNDNAGIFVHYNYGTVSNCSVLNTNIVADYGSIMGGFASRNFGLIEDCCVEGGTLEAHVETGNGHGGFVGNNFGLIRRCWTSMDVKTGSYCAGGFAGWADESFDSETGEYYPVGFENCFALGDVDATYGWSGGFIGRVNSSLVTFENCYAANRVTSAQNPGRSHGFIGSLGGEGPRELFGETASGFYITLPAENCRNCYYCSDLTPLDNPCGLVAAKPLDEMADPAFATQLGLDWERANGVNGGLPYLLGLRAPQAAVMRQITVELAVALYDGEAYRFSQDGPVHAVTFETAGNPRVIDVLAAAADQGLITYDYTVTPAYGSFIEAINGHALASPDGWMFTVNDELSDVGVQLASVADGDQVLWYQGTTTNLFKPPSWRDVTGEAPKVEWVDIATVEDLLALAEPGADLGASYRLAADIDLLGVDFPGIGTAAEPFSGVFDGRGYTIRNLTIDRPEDHNVGFFGFIRGAEVRNVSIVDADVRGRYSVGVLAGVAAVSLDTSDRTRCVGNLIGNCAVSGTVTSTNDDFSATSDGSYAGGLVGFNDGASDSKTQISVYSSIDRCTASVDVRAQVRYTGGLVGGNYGYITNSAATGAVTGGDCTGGLFGGNVGSVLDSSATGAVAGRDRTGGFGGDNYNDAILRCYSTGDVSATGECIGGFLGDSAGTVKHCASAGTVDAANRDTYVGGFIGRYVGSLSGLYVRITFEDNYGWSVLADGVTVQQALGNNKSSTVEAEQAVLDATKVSDWALLQEKFLQMFGVVLADDGGISLPERDVDAEALAANIYAKLAAAPGADGQTPWIAADLAAFEKALGLPRGMADADVQAFVDYVAERVQVADSKGACAAPAGDLAKYVIGLRALGLDPRCIVCAGDDEQAALDVVALLRDVAGGDAFDKLDGFTKPYVLLALRQDDSYASAAEVQAMVDSIVADGRCWDGADAIGPSALALVACPQAQGASAAVEAALSQEAVQALMDSRGAVKYGRASTVESTAQMMVALSAAGKDASTYSSSGKTIVDGLLSFANETLDGFEHDAGKTGNKAIATEQGFRGLVSMVLASAGKGALYDFGGGMVVPAHATVERTLPLDPSKDDSSAAVEKARALIDGIGLVVGADGAVSVRAKAAIAAAREAVDVLTDEQKAQLGNLYALEVAERLVAALEAVNPESGKDAQGGSDTPGSGTSNTPGSNPPDSPAVQPSESADAASPEAAKEDASLARVKAKNVKTALKVKKGRAVVSFNTVKGAAKYRVAYRLAGAKDWSYQWSAKAKPRIVVKGLAKGALVQIKVAAYAQKDGSWIRSKWSKPVYKWMQKASAKVASAKKRGVTVSVGKVGKASGYRILWSAKKSMKGAKKLELSSGANSVRTISAAKSGKKIYVQVVPLKKQGGHVYAGAPSAKASAKAK